MNPVRTNLITGFLGVGKTTAVIDLLTRKPAGERWAVLVNEYGDVTIDGALIEGSSPEGVTVREVGGGCVCCASAPYLPVAIHFLLLEAQPDRLLIETTGLGHPARLLDTLRANYAGRLDLRAVLGLVDPADFARPEMQANPVFIDQIQLADVVVLNKLDLAPPDLAAAFQRWAGGLFPPKLLIAATTHGHMDPAWLDLIANDERLPLYPEAHAHVGHDHVHLPSPSGRGVGGEGLSPASEKDPHPQPLSRRERGDEEDRPRRYPSPPGVHPACCGWIFSARDRFDEGKLLALLGGTPELDRIKGIVHLDEEWASVNRAGSAMQVAPTAYRRDSRLEVFADGLDWSAFERELLACRM